MDVKMDEIFIEILSHLSSKNEYIRLFSKCDTRAEGWVKGELIWLFSRIREQRGINYEVEAYSIDFVLQLEERNYLELKVMSTSGSRSLSAYFSKEVIGKDFEKLHNIRDGVKWEIIVAYPCTEYQWENQLARAKSKYPFAHCQRVEFFPIQEQGECAISLWRIF